MPTMSEGLCSSQEVLSHAQPKQAPTRPQIAQIRDARGITAMAKLALYSLHARAPFIFPSMKTLALDMKVSLSTARRAVSELSRVGYLQVTPRIRQTNLYALTLPGATPALASMPPPRSPVTPPPVTHDTPPLSPMTPQGTKEVFKISNKERERELTPRPGNHSLKETLTCPRCERAWPAAYGSICHDCNKDVSTIKRNIETRQRRDEETRRESEAMEEQRAVKREEAKTCRKEEQAEHPRKSPEEVEAERQSTRKFLFDETGKPYDAAILRHLAQEGDGEKGGGL